MDTENQVLDDLLIKSTIKVVPVKWKVRLRNFIIDIVVIDFILIALQGLLTVLNFNTIATVLLGPAVFFGYFYLFENSTGKTIGKMITHTHVVTEDGKKPDSSDIAFRTLCRVIPLEQISFLGEKGVGWHDKFSKTRVVKD